MDVSAFYAPLLDIAAQPPRERHRLLTALHDQVLTEYGQPRHLRRSHLRASRRSHRRMGALWADRAGGNPRW
jgi:hypothetical protein